MKKIAFICRDIKGWWGVVSEQTIIELLQVWNVVHLFSPENFTFKHKDFEFHKIPVLWVFFVTKEPFFVFYSFFLFLKISKLYDCFILPHRHGIFNFNPHKEVISIFHSTNFGELLWHIKAVKYFFYMKLSVIVIHILSSFVHLFFCFFDFLTILFSNKVYFVSSEEKSFLESIFPFFGKRFFKFNLIHFLLSSSSNIECIAAEKKSQSIFKLLYVGRLEPRKGIDVLCAVLDRNKCLLESSLWKFELCIVWDGPLLYDLTKYSFVQCFWSIQRQEINNFYSNSDILLVPSFYETWPLVLLESLIYHTPVLTTPVGSFFQNLPFYNQQVSSKISDFPDHIISILQDKKNIIAFNDIFLQKVIKNSKSSFFEL